MRSALKLLGFLLALAAAFSVGWNRGYNEYLVDQRAFIQKPWLEVQHLCEAGEVGEIRIDCMEVRQLVACGVK